MVSILHLVGTADLDSSLLGGSRSGKVRHTLGRGTRRCRDRIPILNAGAQRILDKRFATFG